LADFLGHSDATNDARVDWLRLKTHMEWFPHPLHTYKKVFEIIHMLWLWMGRWVHHHATTTILVAAEFRELADFLGHSEATNDVKVQWLRPQTHMEWFPHPLHTYTRSLSLRPFI
jgi:hypothetical protein